MRIATWNVNGLRARLEYILMWLNDRQPAVVGLQELKVTDEDFPHEPFVEAGYRTATHGQKSWNGVAILARQPFELTQRGLPGQEDFGARLISANIGGLDFTTVYCPNGKDVAHADYPRKLRWFDDLADFWTKNHLSSDNAILCGDFNIVPNALDSWNGASAEGTVFHTQDERNRLQAIMDLGLTDLFRDRFPNEQQFSWWDYRGGAFHRAQGLRIDFILGNENVRTRTRDISIDRDYRKKKDTLTASDHAPVIVELD